MYRIIHGMFIYFNSNPILENRYVVVKYDYYYITILLRNKYGNISCALHCKC